MRIRARHEHFAAHFQRFGPIFVQQLQRHVFDRTQRMGDVLAGAAVAARGAAHEAALLVRKRGEAMQAAVPVGQGAMAALIGKVDVATAEAIARFFDILPCSAALA